MLTMKYRPSRFTDIIGNDLSVSILKQAAKNPEKSPRVFILHGCYGVGKTSTVRVLADALNCPKGFAHHCKRHPCKEACKMDDRRRAYLDEYDSSVAGNPETMREIRDSLFMTSSLAAWRVVVFDEFHLATRQAQSMLLKILEEIPPNLFFCFCTTDLGKIIPTIQSRAIDLPFDLVPSPTIGKLIEQIAAHEGIETTPEVINAIALYSRGRVRDSVMLLNKLQMAGKDKFVKSLVATEADIIRLFLALKTGNKEEYLKHLKMACRSPLVRVQADVYLVLRNAIRMMATEEEPDFFVGLYTAFVEAYSTDLLSLFQYFMQAWVGECFTDDSNFQSLMWSLFYALGKTNQTNGVRNNLLDRARKQ